MTKRCKCGVVMCVCVVVSVLGIRDSGIDGGWYGMGVDCICGKGGLSGRRGV